jgi:hypothetical protein
MKRTTTCAYYRKLIETGELNVPFEAGRKQDLQQHLTVCSECRSHRAHERKLSELLEDSFLTYAHGNSELASTIHSALPGKTAAPRKFPAARFPALEAAAALVLFCAGLYAGWLITGRNGEHNLQGNPGRIAAPGRGGTALPGSQLISTGNRRHTVLPENKLRTSERRRFKIIFGGNADIRIEINHEESLMEDLDPDPEKKLDKFLY